MSKIPFFDPEREARLIRQDIAKHCKRPKTDEQREWCRRLEERAAELEREAAE